MTKTRREILKDRLYRRRYVFPNAVTFGNLFCGFLTIIYASSGRFEKATIAIAIAFLLDGLDGRVARRLNATSQFGVEFDSFADLVSFGVGPAILLYYWGFQPHADEFGVFVCFLYVLCAASRLVRFNISHDNTGSFVGLATPAAAGMVATVVHLFPDLQPSGFETILCSLFGFILAALMISRIPYLSLKTLKLSRIRPLARIGIGALIALVWYNPAVGFVALLGGYCLSGPVVYLWEQRSSSVTGDTE